MDPTLCSLLILSWLSGLQTWFPVCQKEALRWLGGVGSKGVTIMWAERLSADSHSRRFPCRGSCCRSTRNGVFSAQNASGHHHVLFLRQQKNAHQEVLEAYITRAQTEQWEFFFPPLDKINGPIWCWTSACLGFPSGDWTVGRSSAEVLLFVCVCVRMCVSG